MSARRIIACLDIKDGRTVKGVNFATLRDAGDPVELAALYAKQGADELVFLDISATVEKRKTLLGLVEQVARAVNIPFTVGGGIGGAADVEALLAAGADKVTLNSAAVRNPAVINEIAARFGSQCIVLAIDARKASYGWEVVIDGGRTDTGLNALTWAKEVEKRGAGEILLTSMDCDGTKEGFELELTRQIESAINLPLIASGGAGTIGHFLELFGLSGADAALAASVFHFREIEILDLKLELQRADIEVRM